MAQVSTPMTDQLVEQIDKIASTVGRTRTQFVRDAVYTLASRMSRGEPCEMEIAPQKATGMGVVDVGSKMLVRGVNGYSWVRVDPATGFVIEEDRHIGR